MDRSFIEPDLDSTRYPINRNNIRHSSINSNRSSTDRLNHDDPLIKQQQKQNFSKQSLKDLCTPIFPQTQPNSIVNCLKLKTWNTISPNGDQILDPLQHEQIHLKTPFPVNYKINCKIALWVGDITCLDSAAITHTTSENFKEDMPLTRKIYSKAGYEMFNYLKTSIGTCKTGDVVVTNGYGLNNRYCFHTVGPKYKEKFHTAAEGALFNCYFKVLNSMREYKITTLALSPLNTTRRAYPPGEAAHIGLRVLRRFLEKHLNEVDRIVFVVDDLEIGMYEAIFPLYFPRCENEEIYACYKLPLNLGGINGEPLLPERQIRVVDQPIKFSRYTSEIGHDVYGRYDPDFETSIDLTTGLESSVIVGKTSFAKMKNDVDKKWLMQNGEHGSLPFRHPSNRNLQQQSNSDAYHYELNRKMVYNNLVRQSRITDHSELIKSKWIYINGVDRLGRTTVVIIGSHFNNNQISLERALLYFLYTIDKIKDREYTLIYFHSGTNENNYIPINFLRYVYDTVGDIYLRNLNAIYCVHPTIWFKFATWWFTFINASGLKNKIINVKSLLDLDTVLELQHLKIPQKILTVDFKINGNRYVAQDASEAFF